jgi:HlyD family secretion protein
MPKRVVPVLIVVGLVAAGLWWRYRGDAAPTHYTGFVEGEERVIRAEVAARVLEVRYREGDPIPAGEVIARLDDSDVQAKLRTKQQELAVIAADLATQTQRIALSRGTWTRDKSARQADVRQAASAAEAAERTLVREQALVRTGASTAQLLDDARARRDQTRSLLERAREMAARADAEAHGVAITENDLATLRARQDLLAAQIGELTVTLGKYTLRAPATATILQTQLLWAGELAQPGTAVASVLDPLDKYVQIYVPVVDAPRVRVGQRVAIELDSAPDTRIPGEVSFVADSASFTPEKIETRSDRLGQVYRAKVRVLEGVERLQPGTEGNVYLVDPSAPG